MTHRTHPSFMVSKLWGYFVADPIPAGVLRALERTYVRSGFEVRPLVEAILRHPLFYEGARMVIPPAVYCAGLLRAIGQHGADQRLGLDRRADRPAAVRAAQRGRLGLRPLAGHLALGRPLRRPSTTPWRTA